ncbi:hypothetical protein POX_e06344 [Penicillium oxalicum]|uniref:hypothetical protein n=1 Tax=Penicillium oxalicum TaxID=69781 RepID=UPI0020B7C08F|nr:hypothetical protein POX_e06344 [Penicillium oxalicum]KAI2788330.1 hypothetical protein POX_e06344 [Penicillium oxalicum]
MDILVGKLLQAHDEFGQLLELYMRRGEVHVPGDSILSRPGVQETSICIDPAIHNTHTSGHNNELHTMVDKTQNFTQCKV